MSSSSHPTPPPPAVLQRSKRGSLTPSVRRLFTRYPPAIVSDEPPSSPPLPPIPEPQTPEEITPYARRFPQGYKVADASIPLYPDEVPPGYEDLFNPRHEPVCRLLFFLGFLFPPIWVVNACIVAHRRGGLASIPDPKDYWTRVQWLKLNAKYGLWSGLAVVVALLISMAAIMIVKAYKV